jgi:hypothetical protein
MARGDTVVGTEFGTVKVESANMESGDPTYEAAKCLLGMLGFQLPTARHGVYWATFSSGAPLGLTVLWSGSRNVSFINLKYKGSESSGRPDLLNQAAVTLYHEVKGHNIDEGSDPTDVLADQFERIYEDPITAKFAEAQIERKCGILCALDPNVNRRIRSGMERLWCYCRVKYLAPIWSG